MKVRRKHIYGIWLCMLTLCMLWMTTPAMAQTQNTSRASLRRSGNLPADSLRPMNDSLQLTAADADAVTDSIDRSNNRQVLSLTTPIKADSAAVRTDSLPEALKKQFIPNPTKATWLALVIPGGGQIYNRKFWKLPIFYGGFAGCAYALTWNNRMYKDYSNAYKDAVNDNWDSKSITDLIPSTYLERVSESQLTELLRKRKNTYRRYRDLSIFAFIGVYLLSVVDAYVDAELSNFDITPDLSMHVEPAVLDSSSSSQSKRSVGLQCSFSF